MRRTSRWLRAVSVVLPPRALDAARSYRGLQRIQPVARFRRDARAEAVIPEFAAPALRAPGDDSAYGNSAMPFRRMNLFPLVTAGLVLLLVEPTRGIVVVSRCQIYEWIGGLAGVGKAVLFVSSYLPELLGICDRIAVFHRGALVESRPASAWEAGALMAAATVGRTRPESPLEQRNAE